MSYKCMFGAVILILNWDSQHHKFRIIKLIIIELRGMHI